MAATLTKPTPPPFPEKGTPEYFQRIEAMRAGHAARTVKKKAQEARPAPPVETPDLIDVGDPKNARMAPEPRQEKPGKGKASGGSKGKGGEFDQKEVHGWIKMLPDILSRMPGHEHWYRKDDEIELVAEPATRCLNRLDKRLIEKLRAVSDPAALVFATAMVFGPSIVEEVRHFQPRSQQVPKGQVPTRGSQQHSAGQPGQGGGGAPFANTATMAPNGAQPLPVDDEISGIGI